MNKEDKKLRVESLKEFSSKLEKVWENNFNITGFITKIATVIPKSMNKENQEWENRILEICKGDPIAVTWIAMTNDLLSKAREEEKE